MVMNEKVQVDSQVHLVVFHYTSWPRDDGFQNVC